MAAARRLAQVGRAGRPRERLAAAAEQRLAGLVPLREERFTQAVERWARLEGFSLLLACVSCPASPYHRNNKHQEADRSSSSTFRTLSETTPTPSTRGCSERIEEEQERYYWYSRINSSETAAGVSTPRSVKRSSMKSGGV